MEWREMTTISLCEYKGGFRNLRAHMHPSLVLNIIFHHITGLFTSGTFDTNEKKNYGLVTFGTTELLNFSSTLTDLHSYLCSQPRLGDLTA